jgi:hypothetical protein
VLRSALRCLVGAFSSSLSFSPSPSPIRTGGQAANIYMCVYLVCVHMPSPLNPLEPPGKVPDQRRKRESEGGERTDEWSSLFRLRSVPPPLLVRFQQLGNAETTPRLADNPLTPVVISLQSACPTVRWRRA